MSRQERWSGAGLGSTKWLIGPCPAPNPGALASARATKSTATAAASASGRPAAKPAASAADSVQPVPCPADVSIRGRDQTCSPSSVNSRSTVSSPPRCPPFTRAARAPRSRIAKVVLQCGNFQRSGQHFQDVVKMVQDGTIGKVARCETWIHDSMKPEGMGDVPDQKALIEPVVAVRRSRITRGRWAGV